MEARLCGYLTYGSLTSLIRSIVSSGTSDVFKIGNALRKSELEV